MDTLISIFFLISGALAVVTVLWGALLLIRDHSMVAVILLVLGGVPIIAGGWIYASFFPCDGNLNKVAWVTNASMVLLVLLGMIWW